MAEWEVQGECTASYTITVEADTEEEAESIAAGQGCELSDINECYDWNVKDVALFQN